ncbi:4Fe-4S binding protein [Ruminococcus sp. 5_1_39BFAA]|uniref:4Fe-4S binding protein n=1 Tax=Ruminococcus sp. 5_1_39BFAA TaxID=457412 RepID=UPI003567373E
MKRRQRKNRLIRAAVQLVFFVLAPSLFSTAFAGVKSIFLAIGNGEPVEWNSFLNVTGALLLLTCIFGRHFCGYACAFGSLGDAVYEGFSWIWRSVFRKKKKPGYSEKMVARLQKVKYVLLALLLLSCVTGVYPRLQGSSPWDVFSMLTSGRLPGPAYRIGIILLGLILIGMCTQERFFCQFLCPMGAVFAIMPILPGALFKRKRENCPKKCGLCKMRCPAHLDIDGDTARSGECICCHACKTVCPRENIHTGE